jgi:hypothetical protein
VCVRKRTNSIFQRPFEEKTLGQERPGHVLDILGGYAARDEVVPPDSDDSNYVVDSLSRRISGQPEPLALVKQVANARLAA